MIRAEWFAKGNAWWKWKTQRQSIKYAVRFHATRKQLSKLKRNNVGACCSNAARRTSVCVKKNGTTAYKRHGGQVQVVSLDANRLSDDHQSHMKKTGVKSGKGKQTKERTLQERERAHCLLGSRQMFNRQTYKQPETYHTSQPVTSQQLPLPVHMNSTKFAKKDSTHHHSKLNTSSLLAPDLSSSPPPSWSPATPPHCSCLYSSDVSATVYDVTATLVFWKHDCRQKACSIHVRCVRIQRSDCVLCNWAVSVCGQTGKKQQTRKERC